MTQPVIEPNFEGEEMKMPQGMAPVENPPTEAKSPLSATIIVLLTIVLLAIFAGLGYWYYLVMNDPLIEPIPEEPMMTDVEETDSSMNDTNSEMSNSDEIEAIEADIDNTELEELDRELDEIDAELEAEMGAS